MLHSWSRHDRADKEREELHVLVTHIMSLTNVAFFGLAGASLKLVWGRAGKEGTKGS